MAIIKMGTLVAGVRGTIGGVTYSANGSALYAKAWARGTRSSTTFAVAERSKLAAWGFRWQALSAAAKALWNAYAAAAAQAKTDSLGQTYYASGFNWYTEINDARLRAGLAISSTVPILVASATPDQGTFYLRAPATNTLDVFILKTHWTSGDYLATYLWLSSRTTLITIPTARYFWIAHFAQAEAGTEWRFAMTTPWRARSITITAGMRAYWLVYSVTPEGRMSAPAFFQSNVL